MRNVRRLGAAAVAILMVAVVAGPVFGADATVDRFVRELAKHKRVNATDGAAAVDSLRSIGVRLPQNLDLNKRLTERDVAELSRAAGLRVTTSNPDALFSTEKLDRFFASFGAELTDDCAVPGGDCTNPGNGGGPGDNPPFDPFTKAKGKGKGKAKFNRTPTEPE